MIRTQLPNMKRRSSNRRRANIICPSCGKREPKPGRAGSFSGSGLCLDCTQSEMRKALHTGRPRVGAVLPHEQRRNATKRPNPHSDPPTPVSSAVNRMHQQAGSTRPSKKPTLRNAKKTVNEEGVVTRADQVNSDRKVTLSREDSGSATKHTSAMDDIDTSKAKVVTEDIVVGNCAKTREQPCSDCRRLVTQGQEMCNHCLKTNQDDAYNNLASSTDEDEDNDGEEKSMVDAPHFSIKEMRASGRENSVQACVKCDCITLKRKCGGPDGPSTLCNRCGRKYLQFRLPIYQRPDGSLTVVYTDGLVRVAHTGFEKRGRSRNLQKPITSFQDTDKGEGSVLNIRNGNDFTNEMDRSRGIEPQNPIIPVAEVPIIDLSTQNGQDSKNADADGALHISPGKTSDGMTETDGKEINNLPPTPNASGSALRLAMRRNGGRRADPGVGKVISKKSGSTSRDSPICMFVKAVYIRGETKCVRRFPIVGKLTYASLCKKFEDIFCIHDSYILEYCDNEGDLVAMSSDAEVGELYRVVAAHDISPVRFQLTQE